MKKNQINEFLKKENSKGNSKTEVSINFLAYHILVGKNSVSLDNSRILEEERQLDSAYSNLKENIMSW